MRTKFNESFAPTSGATLNKKHEAQKFGVHTRSENSTVKPFYNTIMAVVSLLGAGMIAIRYLKKRSKDESPSHSAAFGKGETDPENFDQTRAAGTAAMRDEPKAWDAVDEALDSSFPSSDPPSFNPGVA